MMKAPRPAVRRTMYAFTALGLAASLFGFLQAFIWLPRSGEKVVGFILVGLGVIAALYGFRQAFRGIAAWRVVDVHSWVAVAMITAGMISSGYGFLWAFRGLRGVQNLTARIASLVLVIASALGALFGFVMAYRTVRRQERHGRTPAEHKAVQSPTLAN